MEIALEFCQVSRSDGLLMKDASMTVFRSTLKNATPITISRFLIFSDLIILTIFWVIPYVIPVRSRTRPFLVHRSPGAQSLLRLIASRDTEALLLRPCPGRRQPRAPRERYVVRGPSDTKGLVNVNQKTNWKDPPCY